ncbi:FMN-binding negative transcriptional regulator [Psychrobacillus sp. NEAU-3TGS]|uniref:FMN-binding negative transcriptional regulator n=1 Tax=Psychrobacillus sp. NEAU-3TGS TaxID=2995412 RepID=UPI0024973C07|nr:FMN-binding negative transcriptional regulator [Psychrobacillus sp. NEAU-3TGS]MDI2586211.1 FMN-binding negative transcriptional regulator [Psychrobacillus sp. NEAU-3TGS]
MYIPKYFKVTNVDEIREFIQHNSFGTLVTTKNGRPIATHLPLQLLQEEGAFYITGHMAYGNLQWHTLETTEEVLVMFQRPHAYISSSWYEQENVPTWNYQAVHIYGKASILAGNELEQDLKSLLQKYENHRENPILWDKLSPELLEKELKGIVGFKIKVQEVQAAYKLSQNRNKKDYQHIFEELCKEKDLNAMALAKTMKIREYPG